MTTVEEQQIIDDLYSLNCCSSCIVRLLGKNNCLETSELDLVCEYVEEKFSNKSKVLKMSPCCACLNLMSFLDDIVNEIRQKANEVKSNTYSIEFQAPYRTLAIHQRSLLIYLQEKYPNYYTEDIHIPLPRSTLRFQTTKDLKLYSLDYRPDSHLTIQVKFDYCGEKSNVAIVEKLVSTKSRSMDLEHQILEIEPEVFKKHFRVPIRSPLRPVSLNSIVLNPRPILIGGRYFKLDRNIITYNRINKNDGPGDVAVESIVLAAFKNILRFADFEPTFHCCGADMFKSRVIGEGKPFCVQYKYKYWNSVTYDHLTQIAAIINQNTSVKVGKLKMIDEYQLTALKEAEHNANRVYNLLCITKAPDVKVAVKAINSVIQGVSLKISQSTPISALITRKLMIREKEIFEMEARTVPGRPNLFELKLNVQSGTFIPEFIHGDFGRTKPNISSIIGYPTDVVAVDLLNIIMNFPDDVCIKKEDDEDDFLLPQTQSDLNHESISHENIKDEPIEANIIKVKAEIKTEH